MEVKAACPGVSMNNNPGIFMSILNLSSKFPQVSFIVSIGI
jgi:hypothetical protein